jgi:predicted membrane protein DUF2207
MIMTTTVSARRDRAGHRLIAVMLVLLAVVAFAAPVAAQRAGSYDASRFDVAAKVVDGGLDVTETITFRFHSGTFRKVWREIPTSRTDGIDVIEASLDGTPLSRGDGPGHVKITGRNRVRVEWQFEPVGPSAHTFLLRYRARGVVFRDGDRDVVRWRLLPSEHRYTIAESRSTISAAAPIVGAPVVETRRVGSISHEAGDGDVTVAASNVARNGWVIAETRYPAGRLIAGLPEWQQRHDRAAALAPRWITAALALFAVGLVLIFSLRQGYTRPSVPVDEATTTDPPESLPAALAAVLAARGGPSGYQPSATIFDLADRGVLAVRELPRSLGVRSYELSQAPGGHGLVEHEREALDIAFAGKADSVTLSKARARLARSSRRFSAAVNRDLAARGYLDPARKVVRDRLMAGSVLLLAGAAIGSIAMPALIPRFGGWPFLLPLALCAAGITGIVVAVRTSSLSDAGLVQAARWRGFRRHLKSAIETKDDGYRYSLMPRWLVYGVAVGLASQWARYLKAHPGQAPPWFQAASPDEDAAFAAFVSSQAATSGAGAGGGAGAAGGGGSGAG